MAGILRVAVVGAAAAEGCSPRACGGTTAPASAACVPFDPRATGTGDAGSCIQLCNCTSQCHSPDFKCVSEGVNVLGRKGLCYYPQPGYTEVTTCN